MNMEELTIWLKTRPAWTRISVCKQVDAFRSGLPCTRPPGHDGDHAHARWNGTPVCATWAPEFGLTIRHPATLTVDARWSHREVFRG